MPGDYKVFDGTSWKSICDCNLKVQKNGTWETVNPKTCNVKAWTGNEWCRIVCPCTCPSGFTYDIDAYECVNTSTGDVLPCDTQAVGCGSALTFTKPTGSLGIFVFPLYVSANTCSVSVTLDAISIPDAVQIISQDKTQLHAQSGYFGGNQTPIASGTYDFGTNLPRKIYKYDIQTQAFVVDTSAPDEYLTIVANQFPVFNTTVNVIPNSFDPANPTQSIRTITWNKGATPNGVIVLVRVIGSPVLADGTIFTIPMISCTSC